MMDREDSLPESVMGFFGQTCKKGKALGNLDMLITAHALSLEIVLITNYRALHQVDGLKIEEWTPQ